MPGVDEREARTTFGPRRKGLVRRTARRRSPSSPSRAAGSREPTSVGSRGRGHGTRAKPAPCGTARAPCCRPALRAASADGPRPNAGLPTGKRSHRGPPGRATECVVVQRRGAESGSIARGRRAHRPVGGSGRRWSARWATGHGPAGVPTRCRSGRPPPGGANRARPRPGSTACTRGTADLRRSVRAWARRRTDFPYAPTSARLRRGPSRHRRRGGEPYGPKSAATCTVAAAASAATSGTTRRGSPWATRRRPPSEASKAASERSRYVLRTGPAGFQSRSSRTNRGTTPSVPEATADWSAGLSSSRRSRRNQRTDGTRATLTAES